MMALRNKIASAAVYLLMGSIPIRGEIHIQMLKLYGAITRMLQNSSLYKIAFRQLKADSEACEKSWFIQILRLYNIETEVLSSVTQPWRKDEWKVFTTQTVRIYWLHHFNDIARVKSSLQFLDLTLLKHDKTRHIWPTMGCAASARTAASIRPKLINGSYILQTNRASFNQHQVSDVCLLCGQGPEDMQHFISECSALDFKRKPHIDNIKRLCMKLEIVLPKARQELCCVILNAP